MNYVGSGHTHHDHDHDHGHHDNDDEDNTPCYCRGTLILSPKGEVPVEALGIGDHDPSDTQPAEVLHEK